MKRQALIVLILSVVVVPLAGERCGIIFLLDRPIGLFYDVVERYGEDLVR